jgi:hypothetical protein
MNTHHRTTKWSSSGIFVCTARLFTRPLALFGILDDKLFVFVTKFFLHDRAHAYSMYGCCQRRFAVTPIAADGLQAKQYPEHTKEVPDAVARCAGPGEVAVLEACLVQCKSHLWRWFDVKYAACKHGCYGIASGGIEGDEGVDDVECRTRGGVAQRLDKFTGSAFLVVVVVKQALNCDLHLARIDIKRDAMQKGVLHGNACGLFACVRFHTRMLTRRFLLLGQVAHGCCFLECSAPRICTCQTASTVVCCGACFSNLPCSNLMQA